MRCIETRVRKDGIRRRIYLTDDGRRIRTYEVPPQVLSEMGKGKLAEALRKAAVVEERAKRKVLIMERIREGVKPLAIAHEFGVTDARVRQIRQEMGLNR